MAVAYRIKERSDGKFIVVTVALVPNPLYQKNPGLPKLIEQEKNIAGTFPNKTVAEQRIASLVQGKQDVEVVNVFNYDESGNSV